MHYYSFNIGDYASHTSRLSPIEDIAYRRMLDLYYLNEMPLNGSEKDIAREIGLIDYLDSVTYVLSKFFTKEENFFTQKRIDVELKKYASNAKNKSKAGKASAKARRDKASNRGTGVEQVLNRNPTNEQLTINQEPLNINQEPLLKDKPLVDRKESTIPYQLIADSYNEHLGPMFGRVRSAESKTKKAIIKKFWEMTGKDINKVQQYFYFFSFNATDHQKGLNDRNWKADFEFICRPSTVDKQLDIMEQG